MIATFSNHITEKMIVFEYVIKSESFMVGLDLTVYSHRRSTISNVISECRSSKFLSRRSVHLKYLWSPLPSLKIFLYMYCILVMVSHWKWNFMEKSLQGIFQE